MRILIIISLLLSSLCSFGQGHDTVNVNLNHIQYNKGVAAFGQQMILPLDTIHSVYWNPRNSIAVKNGVLYYHNGAGWVLPTSSAVNGKVNYLDSNVIFVTPATLNDSMRVVRDSLRAISNRSIGAAGTLADVLTNGNVASNDIHISGGHVIQVSNAGNTVRTVLTGESLGVTDQSAFAASFNLIGLNYTDITNSHTVEIVRDTVLTRDVVIRWPQASGVVSLGGKVDFTDQTTVTVTHNLGRYPVIQAIEFGGRVITDMTIGHNTVNQFTVTFSGSTTGSIIYVR